MESIRREPAIGATDGFLRGSRDLRKVATGDSDVWVPTDEMAVGATGSYEENVTRATDRPSREGSFKQGICMAVI